MNELGDNEITPGQNGLPPRKSKGDEYTPEEKAIIVATAAEVGTRVVAEAYGMDWHHIASWKRFYGKESEFNNTMTKKSKNKAKTAGAAKSKSANNSTAKVNVPVAPVASVAPAMSAAQLIIQSPSGQEITPEDVRAKVSDVAGATVDKVYIRADEGKAYWVRGEGEKEEHGAVELW